jgi:prepilin-type N-terminal cleavage/methylation domain-containing protein
MNKKGFTLIELLVVIAIIGILSSIAIVYLSDARNKANDAKVSSNITTAATQLELDRANGVFSDATGAATDVAAIIQKLGDPPCGDTTWHEDHDTAYTNVAFYHALCTVGTIFCADSNGYRGSSTAPVAGTGRCVP